MSDINVTKHPLVELVGGLLLGIQNVPKHEQGRMVARASTRAGKWHDEQIADLRRQLAETQNRLAALRTYASELEQRLGIDGGPHSQGVGR